MSWINRKASQTFPLPRVEPRLLVDRPLDGEEESDLEARVAAIDARALRERLDGALQAIAKDAYPLSNPDRRALEAELEEAMTPLFHGIRTMEATARHFRSAPEAIRFLAWREWVSSVSNVFAQADSGWASAASLLPVPTKP